MPVRDFEVTTPDGRTLMCQEGGALDGFPVFVHWGTPMGRMLYDAHVTQAEADGVRMISFDRPGYGGSTPKPGRTVADVVDDTASIADDLGIARFASWGISGGGPHVLACAALMPDRVTAVASVASVAPRGAEDLDWSAGMGEANIQEFDRAAEGREALTPLLDEWTNMITASPPGASFAGLESLISGPDKEALESDVGLFLDGNSKAALTSSSEGWVEDDLAFLEPWGFDLDGVRVPVLLWQGVHDLMVPPTHGRWLADRIPNVDARISDDDGHLTLITTRIPETHAWLRAQSSI